MNFSTIYKAAIGVLVATHMPASAVPAAAGSVRDCYTDARPVARVGDSVVALVDETSSKGPGFDRFTGSLIELVKAGPGRIVVVGFSGLGAGEAPRLLLDVVRQPAPSAEDVRNMPVKTHRRIETCLRVQTDQAVEAVRSAVGGTGAAGDHLRSEIVHAVRTVLDRIGDDWGHRPQPGGRSVAQLLVYSDGLQHGFGPGAMSFYDAKTGMPREIQPAQELAKAALPELGSASATPSIGVRWFGLGYEPAGTRHVTESAWNSWAAFWKLYLMKSQVREVRFEI